MVFILIVALLVVAVLLYRFNKRMDDMLYHIAIMALYVSGKSLDDLLDELDEDE